MKKGERVPTSNQTIKKENSKTITTITKRNNMDKNKKNDFLVAY